MLKTKTFGSLLCVAAFLAVFAAFPATAHADDNNGYAGLIAPSANNATQSGASDTLAPASLEDTATAPAPSSDEQQTEQSVIRPPQSFIPPSPFDQQTSPQGGGAPQQIDIAKLIAKAPRLISPKGDFKRLKVGRIHGVASGEYAVEQAIKHSISTVNDTRLTKAQRLQNARAAYKYLTSLEKGLRFRQNIPDSTYENIGLSKSYIHQEKTANVASLAALDKAIEALKPYQ